MEGGIERPLLNAEHVARYLLNALGYAPAVLRPEGEGAEDQQIQSALRQVDVWNRHLLFPLLLLQEHTTSLVEEQGEGRGEECPRERVNLTESSVCCFLRAQSALTSI